MKERLNKAVKSNSNKYFVKILVCLAIAIFIILLLPILNLADVNCATGDDYGYGARTRYTWVHTHSILEVLKASWNTICHYYNGWQGTWFDIFLFSLQPEVFHNDAYIIVPYLMLFLWIGSTFYLFYQILVRILHVDKWSYCLFTLVFLIVCIEYVPSTRSAIFWYNGAAHYIVPFAMCQMVAAFFVRYTEKFRIRYLVGITILMTLLGGANYQAAIFGLLVLLFGVGYDYYQKKNKKIFLACIPVVLEMIGLLISMKAPGNKVRGGEDFGFSISRVIYTVCQSFVCGLKDIKDYIAEKPLAFIGMLFLFILSVCMFSLMKNIPNIKCVTVMILGLLCMYFAMQAPAIYAGVDVSGGVYNTNYQVCMLMLAGIEVILANKLAIRIDRSDKHISKSIFMSGIVLCFILLIGFRSNFKESTSWKCYEYSVSGREQIYENQMNYWKSLLLNEDIQDVILPSINDDQGPLMFMPVTSDPNSFTSSVVREFYDKNSVIAISRDEWIEQYGEPVLGELPY